MKPNNVSMIRFAILQLLVVVVVVSVRLVPSSFHDEMMMANEQKQQYNVLVDVPVNNNNNYYNVFVQGDREQQLRRRLEPQQQQEEAQVENNSNNTATNDDNDNDASTGSNSHKIVSLPLLDGPLPTDLYSGLLKANEEGDKKLFYWLVAPEGGEDTAPLVIWLNGGPGCSSSDGFFLENGPLMFSEDNKLVPNEHSWHKLPAWVLYIDQPVGTGLSYSKKKIYPKNDDEIDADFVYFLEEFFLFHKDKFLVEENKVKVPIYFTGESHAGHYIPSMMDYILKKQQQENNNSNRVTMSLGGAAIGNGWIDPYYQYGVSDMAYSLGWIDMAQKSYLDKKEKECQIQIAEKNNYNYSPCYELLDIVVDQAYGGNSDKKVSIYDVTKSESRNAPRTFPEGHRTIEYYLGGKRSKNNLVSLPDVQFKDVLEAIHATESLEVGGMTYQECTDPPYFALQHQDGLGVMDQITSLLENNIPMFFFNGMNDLICNHIGTEKALLHSLKWSKIKDWSAAVRSIWNTQQQQEHPVAAYVQQYQNLMYMKIPNSGHMFIKDQPQVALEMMKQFIQHHSFDVTVQNIQKDTYDQIQTLTC